MLATDNSSPCDSCKGKGKTYAHLNYGNGRGEWKWVDCLACDGAGTLSPEQRLRIEAGRRLRDRRKAEPWRSVREEAARLSLDVVELSDAENGRLPLERVREIEAMG